MNRMEEYEAMRKALESVPPSDCVQKAIRRHARKKAVSRTLLSFAVVLFLFVGTVNLFPTVAAACGEIPFLAELTQLLTFRPSVQEMVENAYIQPVEQEQSSSGITARVEYLIVDQKQVNIYYRLFSDTYESLSATPKIRDAQGEPVSAVVSSGGVYDQNEDLREITVDFLEDDVPETLSLTLKIYDNGSDSQLTAVENEEDLPEEPETLVSLTFPLEFDPRFTAQGRTEVLNQTMELDGQKLTITKLEIYPSHIRIHVEESPENTAWIKNLHFYLELDNGKHIEKIANGISASGSQDHPAMTIFRAESSYFADAQCIRLVVTGADFLDKDREQVQIQLKTLAHDPLPEGVELADAHLGKQGWVLDFAIRDTEENHVQAFSGQYEDAQGQSYEISHFSSFMFFGDRKTGEEKEGWSGETYYLDGFYGDVVSLHPSYSRFWIPDNPVVAELQSD